MDSETTIQELFDFGEEIDNVSLNIDYQIIQHFSQHLYGSPNKAIEELVANSFDAFAKKVYVYLKGKFTSDYILVWDNGNSMDVDQLKNLWKIADSPKSGEKRIIKENGLPDRAIIGKFGIGKLASYSIGDEIVHICRRNSEFLLVHVNYGDFLDRNDASNSPSSGKPHITPIKKITEDEAKQLVKSLFNEGSFDEAKTNPLGFTDFFAQEHWTLAIIGKLKKELKQGRLLWLLGNGMPLRPDFEIFVNDEKVESKLESNANTNWNFNTEEVRKQILSDWKDAVNDLENPEITGEISFGKQTGLNANKPKEEIPYVEFPYLGKVWSEIKLFDNPLNDIKADRIGRSYGFFIMVRERLINPDDAQYILSPDPHFGTFYRCQYFLHFNKDEDLLADRERFRKDTIGYKEMKLLLSSLAKVTRSKIYTDLEKEVESSKTENLLPIKSSNLFRLPLSSLLARTDFEEGVSFNLTKPEIVREPSGEDKPMAKISLDGKGFSINTSHPYYTVLEERLGKKKKFQPFYQALDLISISELILQGYLYDLGISDEKVRKIVNWRDELFRQLAENYRINKSNFAMELKNTSYLGWEVFEVALANILEDMGFKCERDGASGEKDILLLATIGTESYKFIFEAKGSANPVRNVPAAVASAAAHRDAVGATHAVIVAREFDGLTKDTNAEDRAILNECKATSGVSIMTVEALIKLHEVMDEYQYPLDLLKDIFTKLETPFEKLKSIETLQNPTDNFEYQAFLESVWRKQANEAEGEFVDVNTIRQENTVWKKTFSETEFAIKIVALATIAGGVIILKSDNQKINIKQHPEKIIGLIERILAS
jgi:Histidine kinase-, DNA gyrase B-, and HSP90-like ATPase